jgi:hypothetical protein
MLFSGHAQPKDEPDETIESKKCGSIRFKPIEPLQSPVSRKIDQNVITPPLPYFV